MPDTSKLIPVLQPGHDELVVDKDRFSAFSGNDLEEVLRSGRQIPISVRG
jgi:isochorismate hydrolase